MTLKELIIKATGISESQEVLDLSRPILGFEIEILNLCDCAETCNCFILSNNINVQTKRLDRKIGIGVSQQ